MSLRNTTVFINMKTKLLSIVISTSVMLSSCAMNYITWNANKNIKKVELGMSKSDVIRIMGDLYIVNSNSLNAESKKEEVLVYKSDSTEEFRLKFTDNVLVSWDRVHVNAIVTKDQLKE
jgi:hypothetical protein